MIVWVLITIYALFLLWRIRRCEASTVSIKEHIAVIMGFLCIMILMSICYSRTYSGNNFRLEYAASKCKISTTRDVVKITTSDNRDFVISKDRMVVYDAPSPEEETIEIIGQTREYSSTIPDFLYEMYFLEKPIHSTEYVINHINISKAKQQ